MPLAPDYCSPAELAAWLSDTEDADMAGAIAAASRAIDHACDRQFGVTDTAEPAKFKAEYWRGRTYINIDDTFDADLTVTDVDSFELYPLRHKPYTQIQIPKRVGDLVEVTAVWGWPEVPGPIKQATLTQAARFWTRRDTPGGALTSEQVDDVRRGWAAVTAADLDPDVSTAIAPFRRIWAAV